MAEPSSVTVELSERLPVYVSSPCSVNCQYKVKAFKDYYLITLQIDSFLPLTCQRCLGEFTHHYKNQTELAICDSEETAERMMSEHECLVATYQVDLQELLTDDLHLYAPAFHSNMSDCDHEIDKFIHVETE
ncbi:hypothetical protein BN59_03581 [Legionella massiliensis]|uniref:Metal-binding protein n=2 Tax=Legionella massiliensis TaxID=1034943 RepID=A0A078L5P5_9GAMM|nr:hypothetical protein BN59_03581 [Legionella massiliensis]CEE15001.1 hypothetical protein BN1094_03581 [Legionella massiliensis]